MIPALRAYGPALIWAAGLLLLGSQRDIHGPDIDLPIDKLAHFCMYGVLGALMARGWRRARQWPARGWSVLGALVIGACDELHQRIVPGRSADLADWLADAVGIVLGFLLVSWMGTTRKRGGDES